MRRPAVVLAVLAMLAGAALTRPGAVPAEQDAATAAALRAQLASERRSGDRLEKRLRAELRRARRALVASTGDEPLTAAERHLRVIEACESGGNPQAVSAGGTYRGALQFDFGTWRSVGGTGDPAAASLTEQRWRGLVLYNQRGWHPWPVCGRIGG